MNYQNNIFQFLQSDKRIKIEGRAINLWKEKRMCHRTQKIEKDLMDMYKKICF